MVEVSALAVPVNRHVLTAAALAVRRAVAVPVHVCPSLAVTRRNVRAGLAATALPA